MSRIAHINSWQYAYIKHCKIKYKTSYSNLLRQSLQVLNNNQELLESKLVLPTAFFKTEKVHTISVSFGKVEDIELFDNLLYKSGWEVRDFMVLSIVIYDRFMSKNT